VNPEKRARRCKCHKSIIHVEKDELGQAVKRYCIAAFPRKKISKDETYLSTWGSTDEIPATDPGPAVQRGASLND